MEERLKRVRKQLDNLGYMQVLVPEALPLVDKLTADLIQTTESLKKYKQIAKEAIEERNNLQLGAEPYKFDNAKLVKECNDLHLAFLQFREQNEKLQKDLKRRLLCFEKDKFECNSECERLKKKIRDLEFESAKKTDRLLSVNKNSKSGIKSSIRSNLTKNKFISKSNIEMNATRPTADHQIQNLNKQIHSLKEEIFQFSDLNETQKLQIDSRDKEIERLTQLLEGGRPICALNKDYVLKDSESIINQLQKRNSFLVKERTELEARLKESVDKQHEAMKRALLLADRNKQLEDELRDIDQMALAVEAECNSAIKSTTTKVGRLEDQVHELNLHVQGLERELTEMKRDKQKLLADVDSVRMERKHLQGVLESSLDEKKRLSDMFRQLKIIENDLNLEIDRLVQASANQKRKISDLECQLLTGRVESTLDPYIKPHRPVDPYKSDRDFNASAYSNPSDLSSKRRLNANSTEPFKPEHNYYANEYRRLTEQFNNSNRLNQKRVGNSTEQSDLDYYVKENKRLIEQLNSYSSGLNQRVDEVNTKDQLIATLQHENKTLAQEKHNLMTRLENSRNNVDGADFDGLSWKAAVRKVERDRDMLKSDLFRLEQERDALRQRLKVTMESQLAERSKFEKSLSDADNQIRKLELERHELVQTQGSRRGTISNLEEQCMTLKEQLRINQTDLNQYKTLYSQVKTLQEQTDTALADSQGQIAQLEKELSGAKEQIRGFERLANEDITESFRKEILALKQQLARIDKEKDELLISLDFKTERIAALEQDLKIRETSLEIAETTIVDLRRKLNKTFEDSSARERLLKTNDVELTAVREELSMVTRTKESCQAENRRLQDDLASALVKSRTAQSEINDHKREIEDLKTQLQTYVTEVKRFEDLIGQKEAERSELLDHFKSLSQEAYMLETNNHTLEHEANQSKVQLSVTLDHVTDLESRLTNQDSKVTDYEKKISDLRMQILSLEDQVRRCKDKQMDSEKELVAIRQLCARLDQQKDKLLREVREKDLQNMQITEDVNRLRRESDSLHSTLERDRSSLENIEKLLSDTREEAIKHKLINEELEHEIKTLREKLDDYESKFLNATEQLNFYQERALDFNEQNKQLRREIANEKFFRVRDDEGKRHPSL